MNVPASPGAAAIRRGALAFGLVAVLLAALIGLAGANPAVASAALLSGAFGERYTVAETLVSATPLALVGLGVLPALRAGLFTIGAPGQLMAGAALAVASLRAVPEAGTSALLVLGALSGIAGGALYALLPALLRAYFRVSEILSTLLLNYIAGFGLLWALKGPLGAAMQTATPRSDPLSDAALIPNLLEGTRLHWGLLAVLMLACALLFWTGTRAGLVYRLFAVRPRLAARLGLSEPRAAVATITFAGAVAGFAGWVQVAGVAGTLYPSVDGGLGFSGILVAVLGGLHPLGILLAALLFGALATGAQGLQFGTGVPAAIAVAAEGFVLLAAALAFRRALPGAAAVPPAPQPEPAFPEAARP